MSSLLELTTWALQHQQYGLRLTDILIEVAKQANVSRCHGYTGAHQHAVAWTGLPVRQPHTCHNTLSFPHACTVLQVLQSHSDRFVEVEGVWHYSPSPTSTSYNSQNGFGELTVLSNKTNHNTRFSPSPLSQRGSGGLCLSLSPFFDEIHRSQHNTPISEQENSGQFCNSQPEVIPFKQSMDDCMSHPNSGHKRTRMR